MTDHTTPQDQDENHDGPSDGDAGASDPTRQKLELLFKLLRSSDDIFPTGPTPGDSNSVTQRFRLLRHHKSGGLGDIWIAHDEELNREVALKEIQPHLAGQEESRSRFVREATITGQLEHPSIVPIYALGRHENGQPFYAMRFVPGKDLAKAIEDFHSQKSNSSERNLQRRMLVTRLIDVCNAIAYAHSRKVVHRDLKPENIMLGEFGETQVIDWGLAKRIGEVTDETTPNVAESLHDSDDPSRAATRQQGTPPAPTQMGSKIGSPAYMSPEQAAGRMDQIGFATDIYSLGATLYELLTGQTPIGAEPRNKPRKLLSAPETLKRVREGRFPRPSTVNPDVPRALEAVCLKAMSLRPEDRYAKARDLAADLEAWLADEPVTAWTEPLLVRTRRWMRRHQTAVVSAAAAALVAIVALSVLAYVVTDRNERLATATGNLERSNQQVKAEVENARAVLVFFRDNVLAAARPESQVGGLGVDATIRDAVDAAEPLIGPAFKDQPLVEAAIRSTLGQTYSYLGEAELAIQQADRSRELRSERLSPDHPDILESMNNLAMAYQDAGKVDLTVPLLEETLDKMKAKLGTDHPITLNSMNNLGLAYQVAGKLDLALPLLEETLAKMKTRLGPDNDKTLHCMNNLALTYHYSGKLDQALSLLEKTLEKMKEVFGPDHPNTLMCMNNLAIAYKAAGKLDQALLLYQEALEKMKTKLRPDHPNTLRVMGSLAAAYQAAGRFTLAPPLLEQMMEKLKEKRGADHPDTLKSMNSLAVAYHAASKLNLAIPLFEQTLEKRKTKLGADHPDTLVSMINLAMAYAEGDERDLIIPLLEQILENRKTEHGPDHLITLACMKNLASAYQGAGKHNLALPLYDQTLRKMKKELGPDDPDTINCMDDLAKAHKDAGRFDEAEPLFREALAGHRHALGFADSDTQTIIVNLIDCYTKLRQPEKAEPLLRELVEFTKEKSGTDSPNYVRLLTLLCENLLEQRKHADAEPLIRECLTTREKKQPDDWRTFNTKSMLGGSLLGQKKYTDAEPLLLAGYEGMKQHEADIPAQGKIRLTEAIQRLVDLYDATDQKDKAVEWRTKLEAAKLASESNAKPPKPESK